MKKLTIYENNDKKISTSLKSLFEEYRDKLDSLTNIANYVRGKDELIHHFLSGSKTPSFMAKEIFNLDPAVKSLDAEYWQKAIDMTDVLEVMAAKNRNEWSEMIHEKTTPSFNEENVLPTIQDLLMSRDKFFAEKVDGIFQKLSGKHVTNSPIGFRERMIIEYALDRFGWINYNVAEYIHDLRCVINKINGVVETLDTRNDLSRIARSKQFGTWHDFDDSFRIKLFKKGTAHIEVSDLIAMRLNDILSTIYPNAIPTNNRKKDERKKPDITYESVSISFESRKKISDLIDKVRKDEIYLNFEENSSECREEVLNVIKYLDGSISKTKNNNLIKINFNYDVEDVLAKIVRTGSLPEMKSHQFYPTKENLAKKAIELANINTQDNVLEPSAGHGGIATFIDKKQLTCVEIDPLCCKILEKKGFETINQDFLNWNNDYKLKFSKIVMNPPFNKGQLESHIRHAFKMLKDGGVLVSIVPTGVRFKDLKDLVLESFGPFCNEFDSTKINVNIIKIKK